MVTDGAAAVRAFAAGHQIRADVPAAPVVDTVGAGDAFGGAFLTWWMGNGLGRADLSDPEAVRGATQAAIYASVVTCTRRGAEPPWAYELAGHDGWRWLSPGDQKASPGLTGPVTSRPFSASSSGATVDVALLAYGARRLLAERRFSLSRTIVAGLAGQALTSAIFTAMASGWHLGAHGLSPAYGVVLGFAALSWACGLLLAMAILVTWQAFIPAGTIPPPASWPRSLRSRAARSRRYWQIVRIFTRCGVGPLLPGTSGGQVGRAGPVADRGAGPKRRGVREVRPGPVHPPGLAAAGVHQPSSACCRTGSARCPGPRSSGCSARNSAAPACSPRSTPSRWPRPPSPRCTRPRCTPASGWWSRFSGPGVTSLVERDLDIIARLARRAEARLGVGQVDRRGEAGRGLRRRAARGTGLPGGGGEPRGGWRGRRPTASSDGSER